MATSKYTSFTLKSPFTSRLHRERQSVLHAEASTTSKTGWPNFWWLGRPISAWKLESRVDSKSIAMIFFVAFWKTSSIRLRLYWRNLPILAEKSSKIAACMSGEGGGKGKGEGTHNHDHVRSYFKTNWICCFLFPCDKLRLKEALSAGMIVVQSAFAR